MLSAMALLAQTPFTYQGRLDHNGDPYNGTIIVRLRLYENLGDGSPIRTETISGVQVKQGLFAATANSFTPADFPGAARYLKLEISEDGGLTFLTIFSRQAVTWTPYAISANAVSGNVPASQISGKLDPGQIDGGNFTRSMGFNSGATFSTQLGPPFGVGTNNIKVSNLNADLLDGLHATAFLERAGGSMTGPLSIGASTAINFGSQTRQMLNLWSTDYGIGVQNSTEYFRSSRHFAWYRNGVHSDTTYAPGSGGSTLMTLNENGELTLKGGSAGFYTLNRNNTNQTWGIYSRNSGGIGQLALWSSGSGDTAAFSPNGDLYLVGELSATAVTIRGGADLAEPFAMTRPEEMDPGTVVAIDEENEGRLVMSRQDYDTRVAGVISGAGGIRPGLRLRQEGVMMEGDHHVALSGRVYVKADASPGAIKPGDLLTTSATPGHAMRAGDPRRARGAILGKAMSRLDHGLGLVLVLVTLQ